MSCRRLFQKNIWIDTISLIIKKGFLRYINIVSHNVLIKSDVYFIFYDYLLCLYYTYTFALKFSAFKFSTSSSNEISSCFLLLSFLIQKIVMTAIPRVLVRPITLHLTVAYCGVTKALAVEETMERLDM